MQEFPIRHGEALARLRRWDGMQRGDHEGRTVSHHCRISLTYSRSHAAGMLSRAEYGPGS